MNLLRPGDKIETVFPLSGLPTFSGVIGAAYDIGCGDWILLIHTGYELVAGRKTTVFESFPTNLLAVDVVERGCACPPIPPVVLGAFARAVRKAKKEWARHPDSNDAGIKVCRRNIPATVEEMGLPILNDPDGVLSRASDDDLGSVLAGMFVRACREGGADHQAFSVCMLAAFLERLNDVVAHVRRLHPRQPPS